jgi:ribonuclease HII
VRILGLDEAGRGCVLGPLVVGGFLCDAAESDALAAAGVDDSKRLRPKKRVALREILPEHGTPFLREMSPAQIDAENINTLEEIAFFEIILDARPDHVTIDAPCHPAAIPAFIARLSRRLVEAGVPVPTMRVEPKADANYPVVGAASIVAKVYRDAAIAQLGPVGSGYPSDPVTRAWLTGFIQREEAFPSCVRTRWGTIDALRQAQLPDR